MKYILLIIAFLLTGCSTTVPVRAKFPEVSELLMAPCPNLEKLKEDEKALSAVAKTVTSNYTTYYECAVKQDAWIKWYQVQKNIFESVK